MRVTTILLAIAPLAIAPFTAACLGDAGGHRKPGGGSAAGSSSGSGAETPAGPCARVDGDFVIRAAADMTALPRTGCYDIYGKLTLQGANVTSLAGLAEINSVDELDLDHTALAAIDTKRPLGIYGKLTVTGNSKLTNLARLSFETAATGIEIDGNPLLASLEPLGLADPALEEVDGDIAITANPALTAIPLGHLTRLTGGLVVSNNAALTSLDLGKLTTAGPIDISDNARLTSLGTMTALYRVTGNLTIDNNAALTSLAAFTTSLKFIDLALTVTNNGALADLGALKHLQLVGGIQITNNTSLVICRALEIDRCVQHPTASQISNLKNASCTTSCN